MVWVSDGKADRVVQVDVSRVKKVAKRLRNKGRVWLKRLLGRHPPMVWFSHPIFLRHEPGQSHPDAPRRVQAIEYELRRQGIWPKLVEREGPEVADRQLARVHPRHYLQMLESRQPPEGKISRLDDDTVMSHESLAAARFAAGSVVRAVNEVLKDKAYNAFCAVRPPGHHAQTDRAGGFCLINHVAVGAMHAIAEHRLERVAIIDFDVHRGDGTEEIFKDDSRVLLLGMSQNGLFPFQREMVGGSNPNRVAIDLPAGADSQTLRDLVRREWLPALSAFKPQLILLSAGFDGHRHEALSDTDFHEADFAWLTHRIMQAAGSCRGRVVSVLEGGYSLEPLVKSAAAHIHVLAGMGKPECAVIYDKMLKMEPGVLLPDSLLHLPGSLKNRAEEIRQKFEKLRQKIPLDKDKDS